MKKKQMETLTIKIIRERIDKYNVKEEKKVMKM